MIISIKAAAAAELIIMMMIITVINKAIIPGPGPDGDDDPP